MNIWLNQYPGDIRIVFPERQVTIACTSPVNFSVNDDGFFESGAVPFGAVARLCFIQPGSYAYVMERSPAGRRAGSEGFRFEGTIVVR